jgi:predicted nuclease with TOPRIM domain
VSKPEDDGGVDERAAFARLERAVGRLLDRLESATMRAEAAEARAEEMGTIVQRFTGDEGEAGRLLTRLEQLERENADLRGRLERGRDGVDRMLARIRFLENQS